MFEDYVHAQCEGGKDAYDLEANLALLKLYQFNPDLFKFVIVLVFFLIFSLYISIAYRVCLILHSSVFFFFRNDIVALVIQKSIMALPDPDFLLCKYLIDFKIVCI